MPSLRAIACALLHTTAFAIAAQAGQQVLSQPAADPRTASVLRRFTAPAGSADADGWNVHELLAAAQVRIGPFTL